MNSSNRFFSGRNASLVLLAVIVIFSVTSCTSTRNAIYFDNITDTVMKLNLPADFEPKIQHNDILSITVSSLNEAASQMFNIPNIAAPGGNTTGGISPTTGYLVDSEGMIKFPMLGEIKAVGLTKKELSQKISGELENRKLLVQPIVNIRFLNFRVTVLGEVSRPTVVTVANEKISILEAIGLAGDMTVFAQKDKVLLIRENEDGTIITNRLNLNSNDIFTCEYYYLKSNDIIYAEPNKAKLYAASTTRQNLPLVLSALSIIAGIVTRVLIK